MTEFPIEDIEYFPVVCKTCGFVKPVHVMNVEFACAEECPICHRCNWG